MREKSLSLEILKIPLPKRAGKEKGCDLEAGGGSRSPLDES